MNYISNAKKKGKIAALSNKNRHSNPYVKSELRHAWDESFCETRDKNNA